MLKLERLLPNHRTRQLNEINAPSLTAATVNVYAPQVHETFQGVGFQAFDAEAVRTRIQNISDNELLEYGRQIRKLVYPLTYAFNGLPTVSAFSIQLAEARAEWRRRRRNHLSNP
jgi:hypothetical protein